MVNLPASLTPLLSTLFPVCTPAQKSNWRGHHSAVLVILFTRASSGPGLLLTVRPDTLTHHPGQVSLPGGKAEPHDDSLWQTALRETREELGMRTGRLAPLGRLDDVPVTVSNYLITPFVAWSPAPPRLIPDPHEVAAVIEVPLASLIDPTNVHEEAWELRGAHWLVTFYRVQDVIVWGATARILSDLVDRLRGGTGGGPFAPGSVRPA